MVRVGEGAGVGEGVAAGEGFRVNGAMVGTGDGLPVGGAVGIAVFEEEGREVDGASVGRREGASVGAIVGTNNNAADVVGFAVTARGSVFPSRAFEATEPSADEVDDGFFPMATPIPMPHPTSAQPKTTPNITSTFLLTTIPPPAAADASSVSLTTFVEGSSSAILFYGRR